MYGLCRQQDAHYFCQTFQLLVSNIGLRLNKYKNKILISINNKSIALILPQILQNTSQLCLSQFTNNKETTDGIKIIIFPIGREYFYFKHTNKTILTSNK